MAEDRLDNIGCWTEIKLKILRDYSSAYAKILSRQSAIRHFAYIDGFAGAGTHVAKSTGQEVDGSPSIALAIQPPFSHCHFIFMIMDANMNVLLWNPDSASPAQVDRMNVFWGDDSWRNAAYRKDRGLFGDIEEKRPNSAIAEAYRKRLKDIAGFRYVPEPMPMRNRNGVVIYYLFFASHNETGYKIAKDVFRKYQDMGAVYGH